MDIAVLSLAPPGTQPLDPADAVALSRDANDIAAAAVGRHPARLKAFATISSRWLGIRESPLSAGDAAR